MSRVRGEKGLRLGQECGGRGLGVRRVWGEKGLKGGKFSVAVMDGK